MTPQYLLDLAKVVRAMLNSIGENPDREGLRETPIRVAHAWLGTWASGYALDPKAVLKTFEDGAEGYNEMITVSQIPIYSHCEHHLAPFFGSATISYLPKSRIVGLSKFARLIEIFSRRLQVQERMTAQIADAIEEVLAPRGVGVMVRCRHLCMESRGVRTPGSFTTTTALRGVMRAGAARAEFLAAAAPRVREE